ncbi:uncharacterized protein LOC106081548 isoform X2 [Stomoxys calcitrans]|nr:uncharacterized protein LOC106081548 isoform X2 [Stomoxys calcitrans]XP_059220959.1 uncharacterized protein LOC106081548 isoform X2 [Stomoxys calcitrans]
MIILTNLLHVDKSPLPEKMCKIITTKNIALRFTAYCNLKGYKGLHKDSFMIVEPYTETDIVISRRHIIKILLCESSDLSGNLLVVAKEENSLNYIYAGNLMDIRTVVLNETFLSWINNSQQYLYMNLTRTNENHEEDKRDHVHNVLDKIRQILEYNPDYGINLYLPIVGYEYCIDKLVKRFQKHVTFSQQFRSIFEYAMSDLNFVSKSVDDAKIVLYPTPRRIAETRNNYKVHHKITVIIQRNDVNTFKLEPEKYYYEILYKPEPSPFELQYLTMMTRPKSIYGILDLNNKVVKVPKYLLELADNDHSPNKRPKNPKPNTERVLVPPIGEVAKQGIFLDDSESSEETACT